MSTAKKSYHTSPTGAALTTANNHSTPQPLKLHGSCFCPFVQRVWISLEHKSLPYQYLETDPYAKPPHLLSLNPRGLIPTLEHNNWSCYESSVLLEYLEDAFPDAPPLLPQDPQGRARQRLWADHVSRNVVPAFYRLLQAQDPDAQVTLAGEFTESLRTLVEAADSNGPFFAGSTLSLVDVTVAPWLLRISRVLTPYRGYPELGGRVHEWVDALERERSVVATVSGDALYRDSYERYAENREGTSRVAEAVNKGRGLP